MKSIIEMGMLIKNLIEFRSHNNELKVIPEVEYNYCKQQELKKKNHYKIAFIINGMNDFSGGSTSILRLGTYLHQLGHDIYYISYDESKKNQMKKSAEDNLPGYKGIILEKSALYDQKYDIAIARFGYLVTHFYHVKIILIIRFILYKILSHIFIQLVMYIC